MKRLFAYWCFIFVLYYIRIGVSLGAEDSYGGVSLVPTSRDTIQVDVPPFLVDFTPYGQVLAVGGEHQLWLYDQNGTTIPKVWQLEEEVILDILGNSPSFVLTNENIYMLSGDKLQKFTTFQIPLYSRGWQYHPFSSVLQISNIFLRSFGYTDFNRYLNLNARFTESYSPEKYAKVSNYLKIGLGHETLTIMKAALSANRGFTKILTSLNNELIISPRYYQEDVVFYSTRFSKNKGEPTANTISFSLIPELYNLSWIAANLITKDIFVVQENNRIFHIDKNLSIKSLPLLQSQPPKISSLITYDNSSLQTDYLFLLENKGLWQVNNDFQWEQKIQAIENNSTTIWELLPDEKGAGIIIAGTGLQSNLFHLSENRKISTYSPQFSTVSCLIRDTSGGLWAGTDKGVFFIEQGQQEFIPIQETQEDYVTDILEYSSKIIVSGVQSKSRSLWILENNRVPRKVLSDEGFLHTLAKFPIKKGKEERVWIGGANFFGYLDEELIGDITDLLGELRDSLAEDEQIMILDMEPVGESLFVLTNHGLVKLTYGTNGFVTQKLVLPEWLYGSFGTILKRVNGQLLVVSSSLRRDSATDEKKSKAKIWQSAAENDQFQLIAETDFTICTLVETGTQEILIGGNRPDLYTLQDNKIVPYTNNIPNSIPSNFVSIIVLDPSNFIILAGKKPTFSLYRVQLDEKTNFPVIHQVDLQAKPWKQYIQLSDSQFLLLHHDKTISLLTLGESPPNIKEIESAEDIYKLAYLNNYGKKEVYLLGEQNIWFYISEGNKLQKHSLSLPSEERLGTRDKMDLTVDIEGFWLSTERGLWRYDSVKDSWIPFYEKDGLPSSKIEGVVSFSENEAVVFTQAGLCQAKREPDNYWRFVIPEYQSILGSNVQDATLFLLDKVLTLVLGTNEGISIVCWAEDDWEKQRWSHFDQDSVLLDDYITALHWNEANQELWVGDLQGGIVVLPLIVNSYGSVQVQEPVSKLVPDQTEPFMGEITGITVSEDGKNAWILSNNALYRWERLGKGSYHLAHTEPLEYDNLIPLDIVQSKLGPSVDSQPPRILIRDNNLNWSVWNPATVSVKPYLRVTDWFYWYDAHLIISSLDPALEDLNFWNVEYRIDRIDREPTGRSWGWLLDFWQDTGQHYMIASIKSKADPSIEYRATARIPRTFSQADRVLRLLLPFSLAFFLASFLTLYTLKRRLRARRLRNQEIPYIQGEAIKDASKFFGRQDLLTKLQNTVPTTNYALVGEFRIGKTSIQFRLKDLLKSLENPKYTFLSIFVDLQLLRLPRETYFFHFLGTHLLELAQEYKIPDNVVNELHIKQIDCDEDYKSVYLRDDLEALFEYLEKKYPDQPPIILFQIDEIRLMEHYDTLLKLRALLVREPRFKVVLSGRALYKDTERDTVSPWWNILQETEIEPLTPSEARKLIVEPVKGLFQFENEAVEHIIARSQGMPLAIQTMCANVLHYKYNAKKFSKRITKDDLYTSLDFVKKQEDRQEEPTPDPSQEGNVLMGEQQPTPNPSQEGDLSKE